MESMTLKGPCQLKIGTCHLPLPQWDHWALWPLTFNTSPKGVQCGDQGWGALCAGKTDRTSLQMVIVLRDFMSPNPYIISYLDNTKIFIRDTCFGQLRRKMKLKVKVESLWLRHLRLLILGGIMDVISDEAKYCWELEFSELCQIWDASSHSQNNVCWQLVAVVMVSRYPVITIKFLENEIALDQILGEKDV